MEISKTYEEKLKQFEQILDQYESKIGLDKIIFNEEVESVLLLNEDQIKNLDKEGCEEKAFLLAQYMLTITKEYNRNQVRLNWAENELNLLISKYHEKYCGQFMKYETIRGSIINSDSAAKTLNNIILHAKSRVLEVTDIVRGVEMMSKILSNLARSR